MSKNQEKFVVTCCGKESYLTMTDGEGTCYYNCLECNAPCDVIYEKDFKKVEKFLKKSNKKLDQTIEETNRDYIELDSYPNGGGYATWKPKPQSGFPHYRRSGWLQLFRMKPIGWEDRGKCARRIDKGFVYVKNCDQCNSELHIGRENNQSFRFCPKCLVKIKE